ncbi:hypothetical protein [Streptomyces sp. TR02-1]|uniref:hypothetical protein n=1 Tax=Streptomyces sp. TR02-1 TaxID=3385977 RepID=UPI00399EF02B
MISIIDTIPTTDRSAVSPSLLGSRLRGTGMPHTGVLASLVSGIEGNGRCQQVGATRPTGAPAVAAQAQAAAYACGFTAAGAGAGRQKKQHLTWAFRGHEPWRDPA